MSRTRIVLAGSGVVVAAVITFVLLYFAPQDLFLQTTVNEPLPTPAALQSVEPPTSTAASTKPTKPTPIRVTARGHFVSGEHHTIGLASLLRLTGGETYVRLTDFATSNGPAVRVWLSAAPVHSSDNLVAHAAHVDLGGLKANHGNQNYKVPAGLALARYRSVQIWCARFDVVFGAAPLAAADAAS
jgi:hypothetical protein